MIRNKKVYRVAMKSATIKNYINKKGCVQPIVIKYKNGLINKEWAFKNNENDSFLYIYSTTDNTYSDKLMKQIDDDNSIYYIGAYDVFVGVFLDEPLTIDDSCKNINS